VAWALGGEAEFIIAIIFGAYGKGNAAIATLIGSKVNQWTFLVGSTQPTRCRPMITDAIAPTPARSTPCGSGF
jgi:Ca2+/Na+ antiporter